ncbi:MAG: hypothetical protein ABI834_03230 [Ginsengibacter sp.]
MSTEAKIHLSKLEIELMQNKEWILTKHSITNKVYKLFGELNETFKKISEQEKPFLPEFYKIKSGKISKGENYEGFPYVMLDYPALFSKENIFAIRTMFWWGNFFSITLHASGEKFKLKGDFFKYLSYLRENDFFVCINKKEWEHSFHSSNYTTVKGLEQQKLEEILDKNFFKISKKLELDKWNEAPEFLEKSFREIIEFIKISFPTGEKVLSPVSPKADFGL